MHDGLCMCFKLWNVQLAQIAQTYAFGYLSVRVRSHPIPPPGNILPSAQTSKKTQNRTQVVRLGSGRLYPLSHLTCPIASQNQREGWWSSTGKEVMGMSPHHNLYTGNLCSASLTGAFAPGQLSPLIEAPQDHVCRPHAPLSYANLTFKSIGQSMWLISSWACEFAAPQRFIFRGKSNGQIRLVPHICPSCADGREEIQFVFSWRYNISWRGNL